jgi:integrative and conjugative element protein (TIGR02256 family)
LEDKITSILSSDSSIEIITPFSLDSYFYKGKIRVDYKGVQLEFSMSVAKCYPFTLPSTDNISIIFENNDLIGLPHINIDGSVCFHPDKDDDFERKLKSEVEGLKTWIYDYYICKKEDDNYTYLIHKTESNKSSTLYFSDNEKKFKKDDFGTFQYSNFNNYETETLSQEKIQIQTFFRIGFDKDFEDKWSSDFLEKLKSNIHNGFWIYIEKEPIEDKLDKRKSIENWEQLEKYLPKNFIKHLYDSFKGLNKNFFFENDLYFTLGYKIPNDEGYEIHWDLVKINKYKLPIKTVIVPKEERTSGHDKYASVCTADKIVWGSTVNCNYTRFFGRGKLSEKLINSRILIIGCGALGSSLAETLVRGGCKNISLDDFDYVASGNLCRAKYNLQNLNRRKVESLKNNLVSISPYVNIFNIPLKLNHYSDMEIWLNQSIDYVFDCSTDAEVTYSLDNIDFPGRVFSLSITNHAKELVCVSGKQITKTTNHLYDYLGNEEPSFYEGTGCGYPTFNANFNDINSLLNLALMNINSQIDSDSITDNFVIRKEYDSGFSKLNIESYYSFFEPITNNHIYISNETLAKIKFELLKHYPKEFGGVFVGFKKVGLTVIEDILIPDDFENGKTVFVRHPGTLNDRLESIFKETNGKTTYIGEWHSHPNAAATPSSTDEKAMKEIAENIKIGNLNPVLMIVKLTEDVFEPNFFLYNNKKLLKYE